MVNTVPGVCLSSLAGGLSLLLWHGGGGVPPPHEEGAGGFRGGLQRIALGMDDAASPAMKAYSLDLREKIVVAVRRGMSKAHAARTFGVGATSVKLYVKSRRAGQIARARHSAGQAEQARRERDEAIGG